MFTTVAAGLLSVLSIQNANAAAEITLNPDAAKMTVNAHLICYGPKAEPIVAAAAADEIQRLWNEPQATARIGNITYRVEFAITWEVVTTAEATARARLNRTTRNNFVMIEENNSMNISFWSGLGGNSGSLILKDKIGVSTTAAHEFGHGLGLDHPGNLDLRGRGQPPIMYPRGTLVDAQFQWDPTARAGGPGGTMNPMHRRVKAQDVASALAFARYNGNTGYIGTTTNSIITPTGPRSTRSGRSHSENGLDVELEKILGTRE